MSPKNPENTIIGFSLQFEGTLKLMTKYERSDQKDNPRYQMPIEIYNCQHYSLPEKINLITSSRISHLVKNALTVRMVPEQWLLKLC